MISSTHWFYFCLSGGEKEARLIERRFKQRLKKEERLIKQMLKKELGETKQKMDCKKYTINNKITKQQLKKYLERSNYLQKAEEVFMKNGLTTYFVGRAEYVIALADKMQQEAEDKEREKD